MGKLLSRLTAVGMALAMTMIPTTVDAAGIASRATRNQASKAPVAKWVDQKTKPKANPLDLAPRKTLKQNSPFSVVSPFLSLPKAHRAPLQANASINCDLKGYVAYSGRDDVDAGCVYNIATLEALSEEIDFGYDGALCDDVFVTIAYVDYGFFSYMMAFKYDPSTWELVDYDYPENYNQLPVAMACDGNTIYGCFYTEELDGFEFGTMDPVTLQRTGKICDLETRWSALGINAAGELLAMDPDGNLSKVDKATGDLTLLSATGLSTSYLTSGAIDTKHNVMYYGTSNDEDQLYAIDLNTFETELVAETGIEIFGMYVDKPLAEDDAPAAPYNVALNFVEGQLDGNVTFSLPAETFAGAALSGEIDYSVICNGEAIASGKGNAGDDVIALVSVPEAGEYTFQVVCANAVGDSPRSEKVTMWIGPDAPLAPEAVTLAYADGQLSLSWDAVTASVHEGYFHANDVVYTVTRYVNDEATVVAENLAATTFAEAYAEPANITVMYYTVEASFDGVSSEATQSNVLTLGSIVPPFVEGFDTANDANKYPVYDGNGDELVWTWIADSDSDNGALRMFYNSNMDMDDWFFTPAIKVEAGKCYDISIMARAQSSYFPERIEMKLGTSPDPEAMTVEIIAPKMLTTGAYELCEGTFTAADNGLVYLGVHGISDADQYYLSVGELAISAPYSAAAPAMVSDVKFGAQYDGSNALDISFTAPTLTIAGEALTGINKIVLSRDGQEIAAFENPAPGAALKYKDESTLGNHLYSFVAYNEEGPGKTYTATAFMGLNYAAAPINATAGEYANAPGKVWISFEPVAEDINGNPIDPALISYIIGRVNGYQVEIVAEDVTPDNPDFTYQAADADAEQEFMYWVIYPVTDMGVNEDDYALTDLVAVGAPYEMPFQESIADGKITTIWAQNGPSWYIASESEMPMCTPQDEDGGMLLWVPNDGEGSTTEIFSGKIKVAESDKVAFSFYYFAYDIDEPAYSFVPVVKIADYVYEIGEWITTSDGELEAWNQVLVPLVDYCGQTIQVGIRAKCDFYAGYLCIDNIEAREFMPYDLAITSISAPRTFNVGTESIIKVGIFNYGTEPSGAYSVELYRNGKVVDSVEQEGLAPGHAEDILFTQLPDLFWDPEATYFARVNYTEDMKAENNQSINIRVIIAQSELPAVEDLKGAVNEEGNIQLTWTAPDTSSHMQTLTDDVESYESFAIDQAGDWTFIDADATEEYGFSGIQFPGANEPSAFRVFDIGALDADTQSSLGGMVHSGEKVFACFASTNNVCNDDWMISPALPGIAQTISFWACSYTVDYGAEQFEFYYSTASPAIADMIQVGDVVSVPEEWTEYSYDLPEGAKYFAIRCVSNDRFIFLVDDISFALGTAELHITGYEIYRDQQLIGESETTSYIDAQVDPDTYYEYNVVVVYEEGKSALSNTAEVDLSGVASAKSALSTVRVDGNQIVVENATSVMISAADGKSVHAVKSQGAERATVVPGVYVVRTNDRVVKVIVK